MTTAKCDFGWFSNEGYLISHPKLIDAEVKVGDRVTAKDLFSDETMDAVVVEQTENGQFLLKVEWP